MRVRRTLSPSQLQQLPLDSADMFILSRLEQAIAITELAEVSPCDLEATMARLRALVEKGAVELFFDDDAEQHEHERDRRSGATARASAFERDEPTGVRVRLDADVDARKKALIGAVVLGRVELRSQREQAGIREVSGRSVSGRRR